MAKQTKTPSAATVEAAATPPADKKDAMAAARAAREQAAQGDRFKWHNQVKEGTKKLAPQAQGIVNTLEAAGKNGLTRAELVKNLEGVIQTRQPITRILSYYQKDLVASGHIIIVEAAVPSAK